MTPFQSFRLWSRRAPAGERSVAFVAALIVLALLAYLIVPALNGEPAVATGLSAPGTSTSSQPTTTSTGPRVKGHGPAASGPGAGPVNGPGAGSTGVGGTSAGAGGSVITGTSSDTEGSGPVGAADGSCQSPPGSDQGVTDSTVKVAVILVDVAGQANNTLFGTPSPAVQKQWYQYVIDDINAHGGVACRKIVAQFFNGNPLEQSQLHQTCLSVVDSKPFFVMDLGAYFLFTSEAECYPQNQLPFVSSQLVPRSAKEHYYPYLFGQAIADDVYRNAILGLAQRGYFSAKNGFEKLGFIYRTCDTSVIDTMKAAIAQAGVSSDQLVTF